MAFNPFPQKLPSVSHHLETIRALQEAKNLKEADLVGENALRLFPDNEEILSALGDIALQAKNFIKAIKRLKHLLTLPMAPDALDRTLLRLVDIFANFGQPAEAERHLKNGLASRPTSLALQLAKAKIGLLLPGGLGTPAPWRLLAASPGLKSADDATRISVVAACVAGLRLSGFAEEGRALVSEHFRPHDAAWPGHFHDGFSKLVIFNNGRSRVEFYTKLFDPATLAIIEAPQLAITFDTMEQTWDKEPYAYRPLSPRNVDLLAVRKRAKEDFHQDFTREEFLRVAAPVALAYDDVVALGQSLGAYCALYYCGRLPGCRILASAPRNPQNPKYSGRKYASYGMFRHEYDMPRNEAATPTIVYDSKNSEDGNYIKRSLSQSFPNAHLIPYPYCGHSITRYLLDVGLLKSSTLGFCDGIPFPDFDRKLRGKSPEYLRNLAKLNFEAGRRSWAISLLARALELGNHPERTKLLIAKINPPPPAVVEPSPPPAGIPSSFGRVKLWFAQRILHWGRKNNRSGGDKAGKPTQ